MTRVLRKEMENEEKLLQSEKQQKEKLAATQEQFSATRMKLKEAEESYAAKMDNLMKSKNLENEENIPAQEDTRMQSFSKMMSSKKKELQKKLEHYSRESQRLNEKKNELIEELKSFEGKKVPTKEEFELFKVEVMNTANKCRDMKQELSNIKGEIAILNRTEDILKSRDSNLEELVKDLEKKLGIIGFRDVQKDLEDVSAAKGSIDEMKGQTLEEISKIVQEMNEKINQKKETYYHKVKQLKEARQQIQNLEQEYIEKKIIYENTKEGFTSERNKALEEMSEYQAELDNSCKVYHLLHSQILIHNYEKNRVDNERQFRSGNKRLSKEFPSHQAMLNAELNRLEEESKKLREMQKLIKEKYDPSLKQIEYFNNLRKILECKIHLKEQQIMLAQDTLLKRASILEDSILF